MAVRILLVEDHEDTRRAMSRLLARHGYEVRTAGSIADALEAADASPVDVLISDLGLPDGSGLELMRQIRQRYNVPGIALTGFGMEEDVRQSRESGFHAHLTKPVDVESLHAAVEELMNR